MTTQKQRERYGWFCFARFTKWTFFLLPHITIDWWKDEKHYDFSISCGFLCMHCKVGYDSSFKPLEKEEPKVRGSIDNYELTDQLLKTCWQDQRSRD